MSAGRGVDPAWSADSRTLYYLTPGQPGTAVFAVDIGPASALAAGTPRELFRYPAGQNCGPFRCYDVAADGQRFLFRDRTSAPRESVTRMDLVLNWTATLAKGR